MRACTPVVPTGTTMTIRRLGPSPRWADLPGYLVSTILSHIARECGLDEPPAPTFPQHVPDEPLQVCCAEGEHQAFVLIEHPDTGAQIYIQADSRAANRAAVRRMQAVVRSAGLWLQESESA